MEKQHRAVMGSKLLTLDRKEGKTGNSATRKTLQNSKSIILTYFCQVICSTPSVDTFQQKHQCYLLSLENDAL